MIKTIAIIIIASFCSCSTTSKLFEKYTLYRRDKTINYPKEKLSFKFINDTTGLFINSYNGSEILSQKFSFSRIKNEYLIISHVNPINQSLISLKQGDTIIFYKKRLLFFYKSDKKYLLSFRKK